LRGYPTLADRYPIPVLILLYLFHAILPITKSKREALMTPGTPFRRMDIVHGPFHAADLERGNGSFHLNYR
jgi:hypothetical protein